MTVPYDGEYLRDPRLDTAIAEARAKAREAMERGLEAALATRGATRAAESNAAGLEGGGEGQRTSEGSATATAGRAEIYAPCPECGSTPAHLTDFNIEPIDIGASTLGYRQLVPGPMTYAKLACGHEPRMPDLWWYLTKELRELDRLREAVKRVRELHQEFDGRCTACCEFCDCLDKDPCTHGNLPWPCPTIQALGEEA